MSLFSLSTHLNTYKNFWLFLIKPKVDKGMFSLNEVLTTFFSLFTLKYLISFVILFSISLLGDIQNKSVEKIMGYPLFVSGILIMFIGPLIEEVAFRLSLVFKPHYFSMTFSVIAYYITSGIIAKNGNFDYEHHLLLRISISIITGIITYLISKKFSEPIRNLVKRYFKHIVCISSVLFGYVHILNYEINITTILLSPLLLFPQLADGFIYAYVRARYGFKYSFILHSLNNSLAFTLKIILFV